ncbi:MAG: hypothetical protein ACJ8GJ_05495 [Vitreoscilla sp.]
MNTNVIAKRNLFDIPAEDLQAVQAAVQTLQAKLVPHLVNIGPDEKRALVKMGSKSVDFVSKTLTYANTNPQFKPAFVDIDTFSSDVTAFGVLRSLHQPVSQLADMLDDSLALTGSDAMTAALAYYQSVKSANKLNVPGAATITDDLSTRFAGQGARAPGKAPTAA